MKSLRHWKLIHERTSQISNVFGVSRFRPPSFLCEEIEILDNLAASDFKCEKMDIATPRFRYRTIKQAKTLDQ
ncbi:hypothetical protein WL74_29420 [Burkholderia cepacia]|nr:hypothetical protein WK21_19730 [Burkholderia cepacia]KWE18355.1 hypothetical protein WL74_29420 [Burkholderia cepacia]